MPSFSSCLAVAQGSGSQVSLPSEIKMMVAFSSVYLSSSAAFFKERLMGVFPFGLMPMTVLIIRFLSSLETGMTVSMSLQSPFFRCPYTVNPSCTSGFQVCTTFFSASRAISILALPLSCPHILPDASKIITALALLSAHAFDIKLFKKRLMNASSTPHTILFISFSRNFC